MDDEEGGAEEEEKGGGRLGLVVRARGCHRMFYSYTVS